MERIRDRAREARHWLKERPEMEIAVITHGGFLHFLTEDWEDGSKYEGMLLLSCVKPRHIQAKSYMND